MTYPNTFIHPDAVIGKNVKIDPFTVVHHNVEIGEGTWIGSNVTIMEGARIGKNCLVFPGAVISAIPQDLKFAGEASTVEIGDNTTIREFVTINRGTVDRRKTVVGSHCLIMAYSHIAHDCEVGNHCILSNSVQLGGHITVGDWAIIGGMCAIQQFTQLGIHSYVGGGSLVNKDIPPFVKAVRHPISYGGVNGVGLKRRGFDSEAINKITDIYRVIYNKGFNIAQALEHIEKTIPASNEGNIITSFIRNSKLGIIKRAAKNNSEEDD
ncbi:MAG: acyl-ACP--UDP-N-acetylglucosamine O-acyltransferase [Chitinophagaceae bacterium]|jgi:UDP-N-acetylglucosamine acyltransferase|nr:acyl-ACP--UDP-N-acetylglucosamine O-acyltransferase [Chitinophagaceae bacterium]